MNKSWTWGTSTRLRKSLQEVKLAGNTVQVRHTATDLGCDVSYTKRRCKQMAKKRMTKALQMLGKVKKRKVPKTFKGKMCAVLGAGVIGYGSELQKQTPAECHRLRAACASAIGYSKSGANSWLAMNMGGAMRDPQLQLLCRKLRFYRRFLKSFPQRRENFLHRLENESWKTYSGVTRQFAEAFQDVGWKWEAGGRMVHQCGLACNWLLDPITYVIRTVKKAWPFHVCSQINRKHFDLQTFAPGKFAQLLTKQTPMHQGMLKTIASGKHVTMDALSHYSYAHESKMCPFCECDDSKQLRIFHCQGLQGVRSKYQEVLEWVCRQPEAVWAFAIVPGTDVCCNLRQQLQNSVVFILPEVNVEKVEVFVDGSAFFNQEWDCCIAGAAVIQVSFESECVIQWKRAMMPTMFHSSYRAEVFGIILALSHFWSLTIYCDCKAVVDQLNRILSELQQGLKPQLGVHEDLWSVVVSHLLARNCQGVHIQKVKSHVAWKDMCEGREKSIAYFNDVVDEAAKRAILDDHPELYTAFEHEVLERENVMSNLAKYHSFLCEIHDHYHAQNPKPEPVSNLPDFAALASVAPPFWTVPVPTPEQAKSCPYGEEFALIFAKWMAPLQWGYGRPMSGLELYMSFAMSTRCLVPVKIAQKKFRLRQRCPVADQASLALNTQSRVWLNFLQWWLEVAGNPVQLIMVKKALREYGHCVPVRGFACRPQLPNAVQVGQALWEYFHTCGITTRDMRKCWSYKGIAEGGG